MSLLNGNEKVKVYGNLTETLVPIDKILGSFEGFTKKLDKIGANKFINSSDINIWFGKTVDLNEIEAGVHFINVDEGNTTNAPAVGIYKVSDYEIDNYKLQEAERYSTGERFTRARIGSLWGLWTKTGDKEVTPPTDLPKGKEGQMLEYRSGAWVAVSPVDVAGHLQVNHDDHLDLSAPSNNMVQTFSQIPNLPWKNIGFDLGLYIEKTVDGTMANIYFHSETPCRLIYQGTKSNSGTPLAPLSISGDVAMRPEMFHNFQASVEQQNMIGVDLQLCIEDQSGLKRGQRFVTLRIMQVGKRSAQFYVRMRTRRDFPPFIELPDPPEVV